MQKAMQDVKKGLAQGIAPVFQSDFRADEDLAELGKGTVLFRRIDRHRNAIGRGGGLEKEVVDFTDLLL